MSWNGEAKHHLIMDHNRGSLQKEG
jgi:hypothetical protein